MQRSLPDTEMYIREFNPVQQGRQSSTEDREMSYHPVRLLRTANRSRRLYKELCPVSRKDGIQSILLLIVPTSQKKTKELPLGQRYKCCYVTPYLNNLH